MSAPALSAPALCGPSRRTVLRAGVAASAAAVVAVEAAPAGAAAVGPLRFADFRAQVGTVFTVRDREGRARVLRLAEARETPVVSAVPGLGESYSLMFRGGRGPRMASGTYALRHPGIGEVDLFLHPVGSGRAYEAVVNQWRPLV